MYMHGIPEAIVVVREYWLESLPTQWPSQATEANTGSDDHELREQ